MNYELGTKDHYLCPNKNSIMFSPTNYLNKTRCTPHTLYYVVTPVKNVTWILKEIPNHFISKSTGVWFKSIPNFMKIPCHLSRFYLFSMLEHYTGFGQVQVMEFPRHLLRKWWNFHRIWSHLRPNCRQKDMRKIHATFFYRADTFKEDFGACK